MASFVNEPCYRPCYQYSLESALSGLGNVSRFFNRNAWASPWTVDGSIIFIFSMRLISDFIADNSEGLLRYGRVYDGFASPVKIWCSAPLITSRLTPGSQNAAGYFRIISLNLARISGFICLYFSVSSPEA